MGDALKIFFSAEESANNRAKAFADILNALITYLLEFLGIPEAK